ncbi:hypothetical protein BSKO_05304 [Bryopsis sp. KO-2023]|nr:hypothetical protein BSKO_05304 [Bryopsis sp. KO-2023]
MRLRSRRFGRMRLETPFNAAHQIQRLAKTNYGIVGTILLICACITYINLGLMGKAINSHNGQTPCSHGVRQADIQPYLEKFSSQNSTHDGTMHIVLIFDMHVVTHAMSIMRSTMASISRRVQFHLITSEEASAQIQASSLMPPSHTLSFYNYRLCEKAVLPLEPYVDPAYHISGLCKLFLGQILPPDVQRVLVLDTDIGVVQNFTPCYDVHFDEGQLIGMSHDTGDACIFKPELCWPMGFQTDTPPGLTCKSLHTYFRKWWPISVLWRMSSMCSCQNSLGCDSEPAYFNGGVMLMDLGKMRSRGFSKDIVEFSNRTAPGIDFKRAAWGEQCLLNNYFRLRPEALRVLPCGCNYQYNSRRKEIWCANEPVYVAHGWSSGIRKETSNPYNKYWYYFKGNCKGCCGKPDVPSMSSINSEMDFSKLGEPDYRHDPDCSHQAFSCGGVGDL